MKRILVSLCLLSAACGKVVDINPGDPDAGTNTSADANMSPDAAPVDPCAGPSIALEDLQSCFVRAQCEFMVRCHPGFPDVEFCETRAFDYLASTAGPTNTGDGPPTRLMFDIIARADAAGVTNYHGERAFACLESLAGNVCKNGNENDNPDCEYIISGDLNSEDPCSDDFQCMEGGRCRREFEASCSNTGFCEPRLELNDNCNDDYDGCRPELRCVYDSAFGGATCQDGTAGSSCQSSFDCDSEFYCDPNSNYRCVADKSPGANCNDGDECPGNLACINSQCSSIDRVGDSCSWFCSGTLFCNASMVCQAMPGLDEDCSTVTTAGFGFGRCSSVDLVCSDEDFRCKPRLPSGVSCQGPLWNQCSLGTFCNDFSGSNEPKCTAPQENGAMCYEPRHCSSDFCEFDQGGNQRCADFQACWEQ